MIMSNVEIAPMPLSSLLTFCTSIPIGAANVFCDKQTERQARFTTSINIRSLMGSFYDQGYPAAPANIPVVRYTKSGR